MTKRKKKIMKKKSQNQKTLMMLSRQWKTKKRMRIRTSGITTIRKNRKVKRNMIRNQTWMSNMKEKNKKKSS